MITHDDEKKTVVNIQTSVDVIIVSFIRITCICTNPLKGDCVCTVKA